MTELMIVAFVLSIAALLFAAHALIEIKAMQRSTHQVQFYDPNRQEFEPLTNEAKKKLTTDPFDNI